MPTLNIKNPRVYELARELAEATGGSMTSVIEHALQQMLERVQDQQKVEIGRQKAELGRLLDDMADRLGPLDGDPTAMLYDESTGLPRGD